MSLTTTSKIRELQIKLYRKAKNEPEYRFLHALRQDLPGGHSVACLRTGARQQGRTRSGWTDGIPTIRDRVIQTAVKLPIEPIFEADERGWETGRRSASALAPNLDSTRTVECFEEGQAKAPAAHFSNRRL